MERNTEKPKKSRFGEILLEYGIINQEQLNAALKMQMQVGGHIGSILEDMGVLDEHALLNFLSKQFNTPPANLFDVNIDSSILKIIPFDKVKEYKVLPLRTERNKLVLAMMNPNDLTAIQDIEFASGLRIEPVIVPSSQMEAAIKLFLKEGYGIRTFSGSALREKTEAYETRVSETGAIDIRSLLRLVIEHKGTDLHLTAGVPPSIRVDNELKRLPMPAITPEQMREFADSILTKEQKYQFDRRKEIDFAYSYKEIGRFRMNMYRQRNSISFAARFIIEDIPNLKSLGLPGWVSDFALKTQGLILISGPSGHGKSTTMASLVDIINSNRKCNIVTLEDPIEYLHKHKKSNVNQREVGVDTDSFQEGLKHIFRQDPDVILIGEMRDPESIAIALTVAETGHLVMSTVHTLNATSAVDRIVDIFPGHQQHQVRIQLADCLLLVLAQRLVPKKKGGGRVLAYEKVINTYRVKNMIREGKVHQLRSLMQAASEDLTSIDQSLAKLCIDGEITKEDGLKFADNPRYYEDLIRLGGFKG
ncbi:MAG: PilT/PilU family type 4a pilus ATPase [Nitrospirae bacterium]|nr:PilT/PilU family type 4a pilus ATPase [Nitrospirota bacterium]